MFDHVTIRVADREAAERFYLTVLRTLGIEQTYRDDEFAEWNDFSLMAADPAHPVTRGLHVGFAAPSREHVDEFWRTGTAAGYRDDGAPGPRPQYGSDYYGGFLLDPDGSSAEAAHHDSLRGTGIDHLWIRVADVGAAQRFYEAVAEHAGFTGKGRHPSPDRARFVGTGGSFSVVGDGPPTAHAHLAFPAPDNAAVDAFHDALTQAGYRDNGPPGERSIYHAGYYGAYVLDPDGNNVELVCHNR